MAAQHLLFKILADKVQRPPDGFVGIFNDILMI